jgi:hypothetical protein
VSHSPEPAPPATTAGQPAPRPPKRPITRLVLTVTAGVLMLLCLGAGGVGLLAFRESSEPDRSTPDVVVVQYVRALLVDRNDVRARELTCDGSLGSPQILTFRDEVDRRQRELNTEIVTTASNAVSDVRGRNATVSVDLQRSAVLNGQNQTLRDAWLFTLEDRNGWRVCGATPGG